MLPMLLTAVLAFVAIAGVGYALVGGSGQNKVTKRAQAIVERGRPDITRPRKAEASADNRRKQILKTLKEQEKQQKKQSLTLRAKLLQAGLSMSVRTFWIIRIVLGVFALLMALLFIH